MVWRTVPVSQDLKTRAFGYLFRAKRLRLRALEKIDGEMIGRKINKIPSPFCQTTIHSKIYNLTIKVGKSSQYHQE